MADVPQTDGVIADLQAEVAALKVQIQSLSIKDSTDPIHSVAEDLLGRLTFLEHAFASHFAAQNDHEASDGLYAVQAWWQGFKAKFMKFAEDKKAQAAEDLALVQAKVQEDRIKAKVKVVP